MKDEAKFFKFTLYKLDAKRRSIQFNYEIEFVNREPLVFSEEVIFPEPFSIKGVPRKILDAILSDLHLILGISYYKLYCPPQMKIDRKLSKEQAEFWNTVYRKGLGEFFYRNKIDPKKIAKFPASPIEFAAAFRLERRSRSLVGIGGGKDSIVTAELLKQQKEEIKALLIETQKEDSVAGRIIEKIGVGTLKIRRRMDEKVFGNLPGAYNGHIPISAIFAFLGYFTALVYDYSQVIVSNEFSSNFGNVDHEGEEINHQWSKSLEFEKIFQNYTKRNICPDVSYFSLLRPFYEIRVVEMFTKYKKYFPTFSSCNRNFTIHKERPVTLWCGECPKCVFVWMLLSAFLSKKELVEIFGKDLYADEKLLPLFLDVLGYGKIKPFDCVGTFDESRAALSLAKDRFANSFIVRKIVGRIKNPEKLIGTVFKTNDAPTMPAKFKLLGMKNVLILGYGKEGKVTEKYLKKYFPKIKIGIADQKDGKDYLKKQSEYDLVIKTPGLPKELVVRPHTTATNLFFSQMKNMTIGVTGSKGKSTTASIIFSILKAAGKKVRLLGNIGSPMLESLLQSVDSEEIFVVELSSYQLDDIQYSPNIAVALNLFPEHMNYHGSVEKYYVAKKNIVAFQNQSDSFIFDQKDKELKKWLLNVVAKKRPFNDIDLKNIKVPLLGKHNLENVKAAVAVANELKISKKAIKQGIETFRSLPHRLELVGEYRKIRFYDDAISTTPESTIAALEAIPGVATIMLGGEDRGYDFSALEKELKKRKIKNIVLFPDSGKRMIKNRKGLNILETASMEEAVRFAYANTPVGKVCLLSTASPSYSLWKNFEEKGDEFKKMVKKLK